MSLAPLSTTRTRARRGAGVRGRGPQADSVKYPDPIVYKVWEIYTRRHEHWLCDANVTVCMREPPCLGFVGMCSVQSSWIQAFSRSHVSVLEDWVVLKCSELEITNTKATTNMPIFAYLCSHIPVESHKILFGCVISVGLVIRKINLATNAI
jgi:hypothetical protein